MFLKVKKGEKLKECNYKISMGVLNTSLEPVRDTRVEIRKCTYATTISINKNPKVISPYTTLNSTTKWTNKNIQLIQQRFKVQTQQDNDKLEKPRMLFIINPLTNQIDLFLSPIIK